MSADAGDGELFRTTKTDGRAEDKGQRKAVKTRSTDSLVSKLQIQSKVKAARSHLSRLRGFTLGTAPLRRRQEGRHMPYGSRGLQDSYVGAMNRVTDNGRRQRVGGLASGLQVCRRTRGDKRPSSGRKGRDGPHFLSVRMPVDPLRGTSELHFERTWLSGPMKVLRSAPAC